MRGKIGNALFKPKQTCPDVLALRFWKLDWKGRRGHSHSFQELVEGCRGAGSPEEL